MPRGEVKLLGTWEANVLTVSFPTALPWFQLVTLSPFATLRISPLVALSREGLDVTWLTASLTAAASLCVGVMLGAVWKLALQAAEERIIVTD